MTRIDQARNDVADAIEHFDRVFSTTTQPGVLQLAVCDLHAKVDGYAELRRSGVGA